MINNKLMVLKMSAVLVLLVGMLTLTPLEKADAVSYNDMTSENKYLGKDSKDPYQYGSMQDVTYPTVELQWTPTKPVAGQDITFTLTFRDPVSKMPMPHIDYKFAISNAGNTVYTLSNHTHSGVNTLKYKPTSDALYTVTVTINGINFKSVQPKDSHFSVTVEKQQVHEQTQKQTPNQQPKEAPKMKDESKKPVMGEHMSMKVSLMDHNGKRVGTVKVLHKGDKSVVFVMVRATGIKTSISAWLVAGSNEDTKGSNWTKFADVVASQIGHSEPAKRINVFRQNLDFVPTNGDTIVIADCGSSTCTPMNQIATATIK